MIPHPDTTAETTMPETIPETMPETIPETKTCSKCDVSKPRSAFYTRLASTDGLHGTCKDCQRNGTDDAKTARTLRNRAHQRALTVLAERHAEEFEQIKAEQHRLAEMEAHAIATTSVDGQPAKLRSGRRAAGQSVADRVQP